MTETITYTLRDVVNKGSCCRKGGEVELIEMIAPGRRPSPGVIEQVYERGSKAYQWASQAFKGSRFVLRYLDGPKKGEAFILDGKFANFLQGGAEESKDPEPYAETITLSVGQIWSLKTKYLGMIKVMLRGELRRHRWQVAHWSLDKDGNEAWSVSNYPMRESAVRASLRANGGLLLGRLGG